MHLQGSLNLSWENHFYSNPDFGAFTRIHLELWFHVRPWSLDLDPYRVLDPCTQVGGENVGTTFLNLAILTFSVPHPNNAHLFKRGTHVFKFTSHRRYNYYAIVWHVVYNPTLL